MAAPEFDFSQIKRPDQGEQEFDFSQVRRPASSETQQEFAQRMKDWRAKGSKGPRPVYQGRGIVGRIQALQARGVGLQGPPASVLARISLAPESMQPAAMQRELTRYFKTPVQMREGSDGLEYSIDKGQSWNAVSPPGVSLSDIGSLAGPAISMPFSVSGPFAGAGVGAVAGSRLGPVGAGVGGTVGAVGGGFVGTFFGEMARYETARKLGVIPANTTDEDLAKEALGPAAWDAAGGVAGATLLKMWRLYKTRGIAGLSGINLDELKTAVSSAQQAQKKIETETGQKFPITAGQALPPGKARDVLLSAEQEVRENVPLGQIATVREQQQQAERAMSSQVIASAPQQTRPTEDIATRVRGVLREPVATAEYNVALTKNDLDSLANQAVAGNLHPADAGRIARENWSEGKRRIQEAFNQRYDQLEQQHGAIEVPTLGIRREALRQQRVMNEDLIPSLTPDDARAVQDILDRTIGGKPITLGAAQRALSALREEIRLMRKGVSSRKGIQEAIAMENAIERARNRAIIRTGPNSTNPLRMEAVQRLEADYAKSKEMIDRSALGEALKTREGGGWVVPDEDIVTKYLGDPTGMKQLTAALRDPAYAQHLGGEATFKRGIFGQYEREVMRDGKIVPAAHQRFMAKYGDALEVILSPDEMKRIRAPGGAIRLLKDAEDKLDEVTKYLESNGIPARGYWDSGKVINSLWNDAAPQQGMERLRLVLRKVDSVDQSLGQELRGAIGRKVWRSLSSFNEATGEWVADPQKTAQALSNQEWTDAVSEVLGVRYVRGLKVLQDMQRFTSAAAENRISGGPIEVLFKPWRTIQSAIARVGIAPPLTRAGRAMTAIQQRQISWNEQRMDRLLSDPQAIVDLLKIRRLSPRTTASATAVADLLNRIQADDVELPESGQ